MPMKIEPYVCWLEAKLEQLQNNDKKCKELLEEIANYNGRRPEDCDDMKKLAKDALRIISER